MKGTLRVLVVLLTVVALSSVVVHAKGPRKVRRTGQDTHRGNYSQSPHGGQMVTAGSYHFELVIHDGEIHMYHFSQSMTPMPVKDVTGSIEVLVTGQETQRAELEPGSDALEAKLDLLGVRKLIAV